MIFWNVVMHSEGTKLLDFNQYQKSNKTPFIIYADPESLIEKMDGCKNNPDKSFTIKVGENIPSDYSMPTTSSLKGIQKKHYVYTAVKIAQNVLRMLEKAHK